MLYIVEENSFAVIVWNHSVQNKILKCINSCFKINGKQRIIMPKMVNYLNTKIMREK